MILDIMYEPLRGQVERLLQETRADYIGTVQFVGVSMVSIFDEPIQVAGHILQKYLGVTVKTYNSCVPRRLRIKNQVPSELDLVRWDHPVIAAAAVICLQVKLFRTHRWPI